MSLRHRIEPAICRAAGAFTVVASAAVDAAAQCALCGGATPYAGDSPRQAATTFLLAALVLLVPTLIAATAIGRAMWRRRDP